MDTVALNCLVFEKIAFFAFWRQTYAHAMMLYDALHAIDRGLALV